MRSHFVRLLPARCCKSHERSPDLTPSALLAACLALLFATSAPAAQFTLTWSDNSSNESGFRIERATGSSGSFSQIATTGANVTRYVDSNLPASTLYRYRVRAYNSAGNSSYSNTVSGTTPAAGSNTAPTISSLSNRTIAEDGTTGAITFTIEDSQTSAGNLTVSGSSSNTTLVPTSGITFGGSGSSRTVTVRPAANATGTATITVRASDGSLSASRSFTLTVTAVNDAPTISTIADRTVQTGVSSGTIGFTVADPETSASRLTVTVSSSNQTLLPNSRLTLGGSGGSRTLSFTPQAGRTGTATVTVRASDGSLSGSESFVVTVGSSSGTNTAPTISSISNRTIAANGSSGAITFTIGDGQTSASKLTLSRSSSNTALVPTNNIVFGGSGANRTVTVTPLNNSTGTATITVTVSDGSAQRSISFTVTVALALTFGDIGSPALSGSQSISGSRMEVRAAGNDIGGTRDQFRFGRAYIEGDSELIVRVSSLTKTHAGAMAGLMYRGSLSADAPFVFLCVTPSNGVSLRYRSKAKASGATRRTESGAAPRWLRLTRTGDTFYAYHSADGKTWDFVESVKVDLPNSARIGLAVCSRSTSARTTAVFEQLSLD